MRASALLLHVRLGLYAVELLQRGFNGLNGFQQSTQNDALPYIGT